MAALPLSAHGRADGDDVSWSRLLSVSCDVDVSSLPLSLSVSPSLALSLSVSPAFSFSFSVSSFCFFSFSSCSFRSSSFLFYSSSVFSVSRRGFCARRCSESLSLFCSS